MRVSNIGGRAVMMCGGGGLDISRASGGRFSSDPQQLFENWSALRSWAVDAPLDEAALLHAADFGPPVPRPRQVFAVALNYADHAAEAGFHPPEDPLVFTKFASCLAGPHHPVTLSSLTVDWEVELVVAMGRQVHQIGEESAWGAVAGVMVGQDLSDRTVQLRGDPPQFSLGKSFPGFGPIGPTLVSPDELPDPDDLELGCAVNGVTVQSSRTSEMIFSVPELIARLSAVCTLFPGDLIFTGTPSGTNGGKEHPHYLRHGDELVSWVAGVGELRNTMSGPRTGPAANDPSEAAPRASALS